jgi:hypothetical protein
MQMRIPTTIHGSATTSSSALQCARFRSLHSTRLLLSPPRIMAADRVPGVKMPNTGAPVSQNHLNEAAAAGVSRLEAAIKRQAAEKAAKERAAMERMEDIKRAEAQQPQAPRLRLEQMKATLDGSIDGQDLAKDVVARALRRRMMKLDDNERPLRLLFAGPSGVGKTAMATSVCEALLGRCEPDKNFKRFNLSEFSHPSKFNRLTGGDQPGPLHPQHAIGQRFDEAAAQDQQQIGRSLLQPHLGTGQGGEEPQAIVPALDPDLEIAPPGIEGNLAL